MYEPGHRGRRRSGEPVTMYRMVYTVPVSRAMLDDAPGPWWWAHTTNRMRPWRRRSLHPVTVALIVAGLALPRWGRRD